jgi:hypothetical protein
MIAGIILFEMLCPVFTTLMERAEVMNALRTHAVFPAAFEARVSKEAKAVILWLLQKDPAKRPTATGTYTHL